MDKTDRKGNEPKAKKPRLDERKRAMIQILATEKGNTISKIAREIGVNKSTVSRELRKYGRRVKGKFPKCRDPLICNGCRKKAHCGKDRLFYDYYDAEDASMRNRSEPRKGFRMSDSDMKEIDPIVSSGISNGLTPEHIHAANKKVSGACSARTLRRMIVAGAMTAKPFMLRRYPSLKRREKKPRGHGSPRVSNPAVLIGRMHADYLDYVKENPKLNIVQYDSVIGRRTDRKAILTITFPKYGFQFGRLIDKGSASSALKAIKSVFADVGIDAAKSAFAVNISDNGSEFARFAEIEVTDEGEIVCKAFFCRPYRSNDKSQCERLHGLIRYFYKPGKSLDGVTQEDLDEAYSQINSMIRPSLKNKTPYDLVKRKFGKGFLDKLGIRKVPEKDVVLTEKALSKKA